jgi:hypothetical protein
MQIALLADSAKDREIVIFCKSFFCDPFQLQILSFYFAVNLKLLYNPWEDVLTELENLMLWQHITRFQNLLIR